MKAYFITTIRGGCNSCFNPSKFYITKAEIVRGGLFIPPGSHVYCFNKGNFAPVTFVETLTTGLKVYELDLCWKVLRVVFIFQGLSLFVFESVDWLTKKDYCLDIIERCAKPDTLQAIISGSTYSQMQEEVLGYTLDEDKE